MFANVCTVCRKREIVFSDQIQSLRPTAHGFAVHYLCSCGATATWHVDREAAPATATVAA
jgi:Cu/Zn superoxide dismutase